MPNAAIALASANGIRVKNKKGARVTVVQTMVEKLGSLKLPFGSGPKPDEDERLMHLFRNRAGLKKAHANLQDELYELQEKLKQQEKSTARAQEQLDALEGLLGNPEAGHAALVFFQLRGLWRACHQQLEQFTAELERQQEERERRRQVSEFNQAIQARLQAIDQKLQEAQASEGEQAGILSALELQRARLNGFWNYFRRRRLLPQIEHQKLPLQEARERVAQIHQERTATEQESPPAFPGISTEGKRSINLAAIAYAMVLGLRLSANGLAARAKDAINRRVHDAQFGSRAECEQLMRQIAQALASIRSRKEAAAQIKASVEQLRDVARYRSDIDTVPLTDTLAGVVAQSPDGSRTMSLSAPEILADDYWYVYKVLLR